MIDNITETHDGAEIKLKSPILAAILAFLFPGAGHAYQGRNFKAILYSVSILLLFFGGLIIGDGKVVYCSWSDVDYRWQYALQAPVGLPAAPAALQAYWQNKHNNAMFANSTYMARPTDKFMLSRWHEETSAGFELGTLYTMIAGILNILVIFDAFSGPLAPPKATKKEVES
jgi:hypothetical protein